jgi:hypothetical protein
MTTLHRFTLLIVAALLAALLGGCATTRIVSSWKCAGIASSPSPPTSGCATADALLRAT